MSFLFIFFQLFINPSILTTAQEVLSGGIYAIPYRLEIGDKLGLDLCRFLPGLKTVVVVHGFGVNGSQEYNISAALLRAGEPVNHIQIDWGADIWSTIFPQPDRPFQTTLQSLVRTPTTYIRALKALQREGQAIAAFFEWLHQIGYVTGDKLHFIGHSLGAHMAGEISRNIRAWTGQTVGRITGLDPAGPLYTLLPTFPALSGGDAEFVDVYHTNAGMFGAAVGKLKDIHATFVVNGGSLQPGCQGTSVPAELNLSFFLCAHLYAQYIFRDSISRKLYGCDCHFDVGFGKLSRCMTTCEGEVRFGYYTPTTVRGKYFIRYSYEYGIPAGVYVIRRSVDGRISYVPTQINDAGS